MIPPEIRATMKIMAEAMGLKGIAKMLSAAGDQFFQQGYDIQKFAQDQQYQQVAAAKAAGGITPPESVSPEIAARLEQEMQNSAMAGPGGEGAVPGAQAMVPGESMAALPQAA